MIVCDICKNPKSNPFKVEIQTLKISTFSGKKVNGTVQDHERMDVCDGCLDILTNKISILVQELTEHGPEVYISGPTPEDQIEASFSPVGDTQES